MPKARSKIKGTNKVITGKAKFKIGGRKSSKGAHGMSTADLTKVFFKEDAGKDRNKVVRVLRARGVNVDTLVKTEA